MSKLEKIIGGALFLGAVVASQECSDRSNRSPTVETSSARLMTPERVQVRAQIEETLEAEGKDPSNLPCQEETAAYLDALWASFNSEERGEKIEAYRTCLSGLDPLDRQWLKSVAFEKQAELEFVNRCPEDKEDECDQAENDFVVALEERGIQGWTWSDDFEFAYDENGWSKQLLANPGFDLILPGAERGHEDRLHLETNWDGTAPAIDFTLIHTDANGAIVNGVPEDLSAEENGKTLEDIVSLLSLNQASE